MASSELVGETRSASTQAVMADGGARADDETSQEVDNRPQIFAALEGTIFCSAYVLSSIVIVLLHLRRKTFPLYILNVNALIICEIGVMLAIVASTQHFLPGAPCWLQLLGWDMLLFPLAWYLILSVIRLRLEHDYNRDMLEGRVSWVVKNYHWLTNKKFIASVALICMVEAWLSMIPRAVRTAAYWSHPHASAECLNFEPADLQLDFANGILYPLLLFLLSVTMLRNVKEIFGLKPLLIGAATVILLAMMGYDILTAIAQEEQDPDKAYNYIEGAALSYMLAAHLYTWIYPVRLLYYSFAYEKRGSQYRGRERKNSIFTDLARKVADESQQSSVPPLQTSTELRMRLFLSNSELLRLFSSYLVTEFCVENGCYVKASVAFKGLPTEQRQAATDKMIDIYIKTKAPLELNISDGHRQMVLASYHERGSEKSFWNPIDEEVARMLLEPYRRFRGAICRRNTIYYACLRLDEAHKMSSGNQLMMRLYD